MPARTHKHHHVLLEAYFLIVRIEPIPPWLGDLVTDLQQLQMLASDSLS